VLGTPGYMAPEQVRGERDIDARADLFSVGCLLFECLAGRPAFEGDTLVAVFSGEGVARDLVTRAARCALAFSREAAPLGVAMVTGRAELHGEGASGEAIDRVVALIRRRRRRWPRRGSARS